MSQRAEILSIVVGILLSAFSIAFGTYDPLWIALGVPPDVRAGLTLAASLFCLLVGFLIAIYSRTTNTYDAARASFTELIDKLTTALPQLETIAALAPDDALEYLAARISRARVVMNTRVAARAAAGYSTSAGREYAKAVEDAIAGGLQFREVVSEGWADEAKALSAAQTVRRGSYAASLLARAPDTFLNFIILEYRDGSKEVVFGWLVSQGRRTERCFRSSERGVVELFSDWFAELFAPDRLIR